MLCAQCASELEPGAAVCTHCGAAVSATADLPAGPQPSLALASEAPAAVPFSTPAFSVPNDLEGIGGWLILVAIGLVFSPLYILGTTAATYLPLLNNPSIAVFMESHPGLRAMLFFELVTNVIFVLFLLALNYLFFTKRRSFPTYFILFLVVQFVLMAGDLVLAHALLPNLPVSAKGATALMRSLVGMAIWIPYFIVSKRAKATFVR